MTWNLILVGVALAGLIALCRYGYHCALAGDTRLPFELRQAELIYAEQTFQTTSTPRLRARVDRVYKKPNGIHVLVELKTRPRKATYRSDIIELSAQRVALMQHVRVPVAMHGYVAVQAEDGRHLGVISVRLLTEAQIYALWQRRRDVLDGRATPVRPDHIRICDHCAYNAVCAASNSPSSLR